MKMKSNNKLFYSIVALVAIIGILLSATYAWRYVAEHKTNVLEKTGTNASYAARLINDFTNVDDWNKVSGTLKSEIRVYNAGVESLGFDEFYARLKLKEFLELAEPSYEYTDYRYAITQEGEFVVFNYEDTEAGKISATAEIAGTPYQGYQLDYLKDCVTNISGWYVRSGDAQINGKYGSFVTISISSEAMHSLVNGVVHADKTIDEDHDEVPDGECLYTPHTWVNGKSDCGHGFHEYVELNFASNVISYTEWVDPSGVYKGQPVSCWIYDNTQPDGWVYWGQAIAPGETTPNVLDSITLIKKPIGDYYYAIHTDMQVVSYDSIWEDAPSGISNIVELPATTNTP